MYSFDYYQPLNLAESYTLMEQSHGQAHYIAGGTDILIRIKQGELIPGALISLRGVDELQKVENNGSLAIGSMTRIRDLERSSKIKDDYPALFQASCALANPQIRNVATIGGNLVNAAPSADCVPPLLVFKARIILEGPGGKREVPIENFFKGPGQTCKSNEEVLTRIMIPQKESNTGSAFLKLGRLSQDIAKINVAASVTMEDTTCRICRLAAGAVAPTPVRLYNTEQMIEGKTITKDLLDHITDTIKKEISPITDLRSTKEYRNNVTPTMIKRAILQAQNTAH